MRHHPETLQKSRTQYPLKQIISLFLLGFFVLQSLAFILVYTGFDIRASLRRFDEERLINGLDAQSVFLKEQFTVNWASQRILAQPLKEAEKAYQEGNLETYGVTPELAQALLDACEALGASGSFVILDRAQKAHFFEPGDAFYIIDENEELHSMDYSDILVSAGSMELVTALKLTTDGSWEPQWTPYDTESLSRINHLKEQVLSNPHVKGSQLGFWSAHPIFSQNHRRALYYVQPLISKKDHTFFGVIGVAINENKLNTVLRTPSDGYGANIYFSLSQLTSETSETLTFKNFFDTILYSPLLNSKNELRLKNASASDGLLFPMAASPEDMRFSGTYSALKINGNTAGALENDWYLLGISKDETLYERSEVIHRMIYTTFLVSSGVILIAYVIANYGLTRVVTHLVGRIVKLDTDKSASVHTASRIREINTIMHSIEQKNKEISNAASKMETLIGLFKVPLGIVEIDASEKRVQYMGEAGMLLSMADDAYASGFSTQATFNEAFTAFMARAKILPAHYQERDKKIYELQGPEDTHYISIRHLEEAHKLLLIFQDETDQIVDIKRLEYERDRDPLTGLLNRNAFIKQVRASMEADVAHAVVMTWDLDNLKYINDQYGHDVGDYYIVEASKYIRLLPLPNLVLSRFAGDEFYAFSYGFRSKDEVIQHLENARQALSHSEIDILGNTLTKIRATCGFAWYPDDSRDVDTLMRYADFAMLKGKSVGRGRVYGFDASVFSKEYILYKGVEELNRIIEHTQVQFVYQPIVSVETETVYSYEALMRPISDIITNVGDLLNIARTHTKMPQIERLTWMGVLQSLENTFGDVLPFKVFLNSVPAHFLPQEDIAFIEARYASILPQLVVEIIESERMNILSMNDKRAFCKKWGMPIALDDFGSGQNSESVLLEVAPDIIKIDRSIIAGLHQDEERLNIVENIVSYARLHQKRTVAEGIENREELTAVVRAGVDYVQGYYLGMPSKTFQRLPDEVKAHIHAAKGGGSFT